MVKKDFQICLLLNQNKPIKLNSTQFIDIWQL